MLKTTSNVLAKKVVLGAGAGGILSFLLMNFLNDSPFMLKRIPLCKSIQRVIQMLINLPRVPILAQQPPQNPLPSHPLYRRRHPCFGRPLSFSRASMSALAFCGVGLADTESRMHDGGLFHDEAIGVEFADVLAGVGVGDFGGFIGVEPDFAFAAAEDFGGQALLRAEIRHRW